MQVRQNFPNRLLQGNETDQPDVTAAIRARQRETTPLFNLRKIRIDLLKAINPNETGWHQLFIQFFFQRRFTKRLQIEHRDCRPLFYP